MQKPEHRRPADRRGLRYLSDLTDAECAVIEHAIPPAKCGGRRRKEPTLAWIDRNRRLTKKSYCP